MNGELQEKVAQFSTKTSLAIANVAAAVWVVSNIGVLVSLFLLVFTDIATGWWVFWCLVFSGVGRYLAAVYQRDALRSLARVESSDMLREEQ